MAESLVEVDLLNPGQVFACLGILEVANSIYGEISAAFDWQERRVSVFRIRAQGDEPPSQRVMRFLEEAELEPHAPRGTKNLDRWKYAWGSLPRLKEDDVVSSVPPQESPATLPLYLRDKHGNAVLIDYWGDGTHREKAKFWGGSGGYPGVAIFRDALEIVRGKIQQSARKPFDLSGVQTSSFRFDWRRDYIPVQVGFSPNKHDDIEMVGFPLVEVLAAIGLSNARPQRDSQLKYFYSVLGTNDRSCLDPVFHRAALGAEYSPIPGRPFRRFAMHLGWPGLEGKARCITDVYEEGVGR